MSTAIETRPQRSDSPRRRPSDPSSRSRRDSAGACDYPVLIRIPNLDAQQKTPQDTGEFTVPEGQGKGVVGEDPPARMPHEKDGAASPLSAPLWPPRPSAKAPQVTSWVWKLTICAAAIGLVILAYRILNGPGEGPRPAAGDAPLNGDPAASTDNIASHLPSLAVDQPPVVQQLAPIDDEFFHPAPPSAYAKETAPSEQRLDRQTPTSRGETENAATRAPSVPLPSDEATLPIGATEERTGAREAEPPRGVPPTNADLRPWSQSYGEPFGERNPSSHWGADSEDRASAAYNVPQTNYPQTHYPQTHYPETSYPETSYPETSYPETSYPDTGYPETNPNTWRNAGQWNSRPQDSPITRPAQRPSEWDNGPHGDDRWSPPGTARLNGEIEQPPLRRANERDGSRLH